MVGTAKAKDYTWRYVVYSYLAFGLLLFVFGAIATILLHGTPVVMKWLIVVTAWTPTYVFLLMFKWLCPGRTIKDFYKEAFAARLDIGLLVSTTAIQLFIYLACVYIVSLQNSVRFPDLLNLSFATLPSTLFFIFIQGPAGEETGWRAYLQRAVEKRVGVVKGSLIVSLIWAFWHAPIWFIGTGYSGIELVRYIVFFSISITSVGFVIGIAYYHCKNLFVPVWIHFMLNLPGESFRGSRADLMPWYAAFYFMMALGFLLWHKVKSGRLVREAAYERT